VKNILQQTNISFIPPVPVKENKRSLSLGDTRGKGQSPAQLKENPGLYDLTGKREPCLGRPYRELVGPRNPVRCLALPIMQVAALVLSSFGS